MNPFAPLARAVAGVLSLWDTPVPARARAHAELFGHPLPNKKACLGCIFDDGRHIPECPQISAAGAGAENSGGDVDPPASSPEATSAEDWRVSLGRVQAMPDDPSFGHFVPDSVTRVVLVHGSGSAVTVSQKWAESWDVSVQDEGRTLKLFSKRPTGPKHDSPSGFFNFPDGLGGGPW